MTMVRQLRIAFALSYPRKKARFPRKSNLQIYNCLWIIGSSARIRNSGKRLSPPIPADLPGACISVTCGFSSQTPLVVARRFVLKSDRTDPGHAHLSIDYAAELNEQQY